VCHTWSGYANGIQHVHMPVNMAGKDEREGGGRKERRKEGIGRGREDEKDWDGWREGDRGKGKEVGRRGGCRVRGVQRRTCQALYETDVQRKNERENGREGRKEGTGRGREDEED
jgi:hypothetical protein